MAVTMMSASSSCARPEPEAGLGKGLDVIGDDRGGAVRDGPEQIAVGDEAEPLVPGVVAGGEVGVDVVAGRQLADDLAAQETLDVAR